MSPIPLTKELAETVGTMTQLGQAEPLPHALLRKAKAYEFSEPDAALLLAATALEAGLKDLISELLPSAEYLVSEMPSPPIVKLLKNYLPTLPVRSDPALAVLQGAVLKRVQEAVELRNQFAHTGRTRAKGTPGAPGFVDTVELLLYQFDALVGRSWAEGHLENRSPPAVPC